MTAITPTPTPTRDDLITSVIGLVKHTARKFTNLPSGVTVEDLESVGHIAACKAADAYDAADDSGAKFSTYAATCIRNAMLKTIGEAKAEKRNCGRMASTLEATDDVGDRIGLPADPRQADPAEIAAARETVLAGRPGRNLSIRQLERTLPTPSAVAEQVTKLRAAMFGAIDEGAVSAMMAAIMAKAQAGDLKAAKLLMDLLAPARSGVTVNQQAVVIQSGDL